MIQNPTPQEVELFIRAGLTCTHLVIEGDGRHFFATIVSTQFEGLRTLARQRLVYEVLGSRILGNDAQIHALSMKTYTPQEWGQQASA